MGHAGVEELVSEWSRDLESYDRSRHTVRAYLGSVRDFLLWYSNEEGRLPDLPDLTPIALLGYRNELQHEQGKSTSTVNTRLAGLRSFCGWLLERGHLPADPSSRLKSVGRQGPPAPKGLTDKQVNALLRVASRSRYGEREYALVQVLLQTGMRIGECAGLDMEDISFGERGGAVTIRADKGNKSRSVPLNASARQALAAYAAPTLGVEPTVPAVARAWPRRRRGAEGTPLWGSQKGGRLSAQAMRRVIDCLVRDCSSRGLVPPDASAHTLRHTFAMFYLKDNPGDLIGLATLLGHSSLDTTRIYGQPTSEMLASRVDRLSLNAYAE
ncbi:MAG: tyrosine-type recombinase/integrase [Actinomycetota bacterium]|nr:tyrosine-type recombinase/integrase [Actinomycetota bacterium]